MKQRNLLLFTSIIVLVLVIALFASYWNSTTHISKKIVEAKITDFTVDWGGLPAIVGVTVAISFNVSIKNIGTENISQLNVKLDIVTNDTSSLRIEDNNLYYYDMQNFTLNTGETTSRKIDFFVDLDTQQQMMNSHQNFIATLTSNSTVLDTRQLFPSTIIPQQTPLPTTAAKPEVHITAFYPNGSATNGGVTWYYNFVIKLENNGTTDANGLTLTFNSTSTYNVTRTIGFYNPQTSVTTGYVEMGQPYSLGT